MHTAMPGAIRRLVLLPGGVNRLGEAGVDPLSNSGVILLSGICGGEDFVSRWRGPERPATR